MPGQITSLHAFDGTVTLEWVINNHSRYAVCLTEHRNVYNLDTGRFVVYDGPRILVEKEWPNLPTHQDITTMLLEATL